MDQSIQNLLLAAETIQSISPPPENEFWSGYARGLRRAHYGDKFGTEAEHKIWMAEENSITESLKMRKLGYKTGLALCNINLAIQKIAAANNGAVKSEKKSKSSAENGKKGGRPKKNTQIIQ